MRTCCVRQRSTMARWRPADTPWPQRSAPLNRFLCGSCAGLRHRKHFTRCSQPVQRGRKARVDGHLHEDFDNLFAGDADVQCGLQMHFELGCGVAQCRERGHHGDLAAAQVEPRTRVDVAEWKLDQVAGEVGRDVGETLDDALTGLTVDLAQLGEATAIAGTGFGIYCTS